MQRNDMLKPIKNLENIVPNFRQFADFIREYKEIIDTGKLAQFYCKELFGLREVKPFNKKGHDLESEDGKIKFEVKYRQMKEITKTPPGMKINLDNINYVLYVYLDDKNLLPMCVFQIKSEDISYTTGERVSFERAFKKNKKKLIFHG